MAKISTYPTVTPTADCLLIGTDSPNNNETKNFSIVDVLDLYEPWALGKAYFYNTNTQTLTGGANVGIPIILPLYTLVNSISISSDGTNFTKINFNKTGYYKISISAQLANSIGTAQTVDFWLRKNGATAAYNISDTNRKVQLQGNATYLLASFDYIVYFTVGDYIQCMWTATSTNVTMAIEASNAVHPATPSVTVAINQV